MAKVYDRVAGKWVDAPTALNIDDFAVVAFSGDYDDLINKPTAGGGLAVFAFNETVTGTSPMLIGSLFLAAKSYILSANIGCLNTANTAYLEIRNQAGDVLATVSKSGGVAWQAGSGFTLSSDSYVDVVCYASESSAIMKIFGVYLA